MSGRNKLFTKPLIVCGVFLWLISQAGYAIGETVAEYIPLDDGNSWTYRATGSYGAYNKTFAVLPGTTLINNIPTKGIQVFGGPDNLGIEYWTNDSEGIRVHGGYTPITEIGSGSVVFEPPMHTAKREMNIGETVYSSGKAIMNFSGYGTFILDYESNFTVLGTETVTVPAGTYETFKFGGSYRTFGFILGQYFDFTVSDTRWLAKYIGPVKETYAHFYGSETHALFSTNVTPPPSKPSVRYLPFLPLLLE